MIHLDEHAAIADLHSAPTTSRMGKALFGLIGPRMPHELLFLALLPIKFELPSLYSEPRYKSYCDEYVRHSNKYDIWLRRSPIGPEVTLIRHSDHTPQAILRKSLFYRKVMAPTNGEYGASIAAWHEGNWLATLTVFRNAQQGDFSDEDMRRLQGWHHHFQTAVRRLAVQKEESLDDNSLSTFIWDLPTSALILDWDCVPRHFNASAAELCSVWRNGLSAFSKKNSHHRIHVPQEILEIIPTLKPRIEAAKLSRPGPLRPVEFQTVQHARIPELSAKIYFIPSKALSLSRGRFLVQFHFNRVSIGSHVSFDTLSQLSRSERQVAIHAAKGLSNQEIGRSLRKSPGTVKIQLGHIFKKLHLRSRVELANILSSSLAAGPAGSLGHETIKVLDQGAAPL